MHARVPELFRDVTTLYMSAYSDRISSNYSTIRTKIRSLAYFWTYLAQEHPEITRCRDVLPHHARGFANWALATARTIQRSTSTKGTADRTTTYDWMVDVRSFFTDLCTWGTEPGSALAAHMPPTVPLTSHDLNSGGFSAARARTAARMTATVLDLQREIPNIRAFALRRWHDAEQALREDPDDKSLIAAERAAFWDWGLLELLLTSGLRIEEACELTTFDVLRRSLPDGRLYYLLHIKPSKFGRARVIPIGDQLGRAIAEIIRHVSSFYGTDHVPLVDRRDEHEKRPLPRAPYLLQGIRHPSAVNTNTIRGRLRWLSEQAGAKHTDGEPLILTPHDCRRVFASEHLNAHTPVHVIQALLGHATINTVMIYAKLYPDQFITDYRKAMRGLYTDVYGRDANTIPARQSGPSSPPTAPCGTWAPTSAHCPPESTAPAAWSASAAATPNPRRAPCPSSAGCSAATPAHSTRRASTASPPASSPPENSRSHASAPPCNARRNSLATPPKHSKPLAEKSAEGQLLRQEVVDAQQIDSAVAGDGFGERPSRPRPRRVRSLA